MCRSSTLTILVNSGRLVNYYSLFWGPGVNSTIDEPLGAFTCRSSTLAGFVDSDPFRGLLLTVLGSQRDFHFCRTPRCACVLVVKTRSFGRFWPVFELLHTLMDYYLLIRGPWAISMIGEPRGAFMYRSSIILGLSDSGLFHGLLLTVLGSQNAFHGCRTPRSAMCWSSTLVVWVGSGPFLGLYLVLGSRSDFHH